MTQLLFQCFSQSIGRFVRLNRSVSYCRGAHWLSYLFLKFPGPHISEKLEIFFNAPCPERRTSKQAGWRSRRGDLFRATFRAGRVKRRYRNRAKAVWLPDKEFDGN